MPRMKVAIVGAGPGGLGAAYDLARAGCAVTLFEAEAQVGGLAGGFKEPGWEWSLERCYHHWFASDADILQLIEELGWSDRVRFVWPVTAAFHGDRFFALDAPLSRRLPAAPWLERTPGAFALSRILHVLRFPALRKPEALRAGLAGLYLALTPDWHRLERVTAHEWLSRRMGRRCYEVLWEPLLVSKFGSHAREVNMAWFWARIKDRSPRLGTFEGGFQVFLDGLAERIRREGGVVRLATPVEQIQGHPESGLSLFFRGGQERFDHVLFTSSPERLARLTPTLPREYVARLRNLKSMGAVVLALALRHSLSESGCYWHNLSKPSGFPFLVLVEHTNFVSPAFFGGEHIVYCGDYLDPSHEHFSLSHAQLLARFVPALARVNAAFTPEWVRASWLFRTPYAQPIPFVNHSAAIPEIETPVPGLWLACMDQAYPRDRTTNFAVRLGRRAAGRILGGSPQTRAQEGGRRPIL
jgi:protoporphyrinogen oxidase